MGEFVHGVNSLPDADTEEIEFGSQSEDDDEDYDYSLSNQGAKARALAKHWKKSKKSKPKRIWVRPKVEQPKVVPIKFRCDYTYFPNIKTWMKLHRIPQSWSDARAICLLQNTTLASPTKELRETMFKFLKTEFTHLYIWTGVNAQFCINHYHSIEGIGVRQIPGAPLPPEGSNRTALGRCLIVDKDKNWDYSKCEEFTRPFICYRKHDFVTNYNDTWNECGTTDKGYYYYSATKMCYKFYTSPRFFTVAHFTCQSDGASLAIMNSPREVGVVKDIYMSYPFKKLGRNITAANASFIGFYFDNETDGWLTIDGQSLQEAGWDHLVPEMNGYHRRGRFCGTIHGSGLLSDAKCWQKHMFICEKDPSTLATCEDHIVNTNYKFIAQYYSNTFTNENDDDIER